MGELLVLLGIGVGTYAMRAAFLLRADARPPAVVERYLPYVGPAVLAAIVVPALVSPRGTVSVGETGAAVVAAGLTWLLWWRTERLPVALLGGMAGWWVALLLLSST